MKRTLSFVTLIILILSLCSCDIELTKHPKQIELVEYIGEELFTVETELSAELKDVTQYFDNTYRFESETTLVDFIIDSSGKIVRIHLRDSGELGYSLCGLTTKMDDVSAENKLSENGAVFVRGKVWQCANKTDCITREDSGWIYMANSEILEEQLLLAKMENALTYQYEDSEGIYYIGNHQFVEYYYSSFPRFAYDYEKLTEYQQSVLNETIAGRYLMVSGTITGVTDRGTVIVMCEDQSLGEEIGNILPTVGFAELTLIPEQEALLMSLAENSTIVAFGRIEPESYNSVDFDLFDTIVLAVDSSTITLPIIENAIPGITRFDKNGNILQGPNEETNLEKIAFSTCFADTIFAQLADNALQATELFQEKYVKVIGKISFIDAGGKFFSLSSISGHYASDSINCYISPEHKDDVATKTIGDFVTLYCKIKNVESLLGYTVTADVIAMENEDNRYIIDSQQLDYDTFWDSASWYEDEITGEYSSFENFIFFSISAGKSDKNEVTYWLTYQTSSETKEIDGDIIEIPRYLNLPSKQVWTEDNRIIVEFAVNGYCEYTGSFQLIKEYREDGSIIDYICVDVPGFLSTSNTELYVAKN